MRPLIDIPFIEKCSAEALEQVFSVEVTSATGELMEGGAGFAVEGPDSASLHFRGDGYGGRITLRLMPDQRAEIIDGVLRRYNVVSFIEDGAVLAELTNICAANIATRVRDAGLGDIDIESPNTRGVYRAAKFDATLTVRAETRQGYTFVLIYDIMKGRAHD